MQAGALLKRALVSRGRTKLVMARHLVSFTPYDARFWPRSPLWPERGPAPRTQEIPTGASLRKALARMVLAADVHFALHLHFPTRIRLGDATASAFLGRSREMHFPLRPTDPDSRVLVVRDPALAPTQIALDA